MEREQREESPRSRYKKRRSKSGMKVHWILVRIEYLFLHASWLQGTITSGPNLRVAGFRRGRVGGAELHSTQNHRALPHNTSPERSEGKLWALDSGCRGHHRSPRPSTPWLHKLLFLLFFFLFFRFLDSLSPEFLATFFEAPISFRVGMYQ